MRSGELGRPTTTRGMGHTVDDGVKHTHRDGQMINVAERTSPRAVRDYKRAVASDPCSYCGAPAVVLDHIVSRTRGGDGGWENVTAACWRCNSGKAGRSLLAWLAYELFVREELEAARELSRRWVGLGAAA